MCACDSVYVAHRNIHTWFECYQTITVEQPRTSRPWLLVVYPIHTSQDIVLVGEWGNREQEVGWEGSTRGKKTWDFPLAL